MNINLTLFGQMIAFICFVVFCMRFVWPPIIAAMAEREKKIADGLAAADRANDDLAVAKETVAQELQQAKAEAAGIVDAANKRAVQILDEAKEAALAEAERLKESAITDIEQERQRAKEQLRGELSALTMQGAQKVLGVEINQNTHERLIEELAENW